MTLSLLIFFALFLLVQQKMVKQFHWGVVGTNLHTEQQWDVLCFQICVSVSSFVLLASLQSFHGENLNHVLIHFHTVTSRSVIMSHYMTIFGSCYQGLKSNKTINTHCMTLIQSF